MIALRAASAHRNQKKETQHPETQADVMTGKRILLTGATGMVGGQVLRLLLDDDRVSEIISIGRRETSLKSEKLRELIHHDFGDFSPLSDALAGIDVCFYCVGVYQGQVSKEVFFAVTCDYQKALTDVLERTSPDATFVLFSASGADPTGKSWATFAKAKGQAENLLNDAAFPKRYIFRPGYIHPTGQKRPDGWSYKLMIPIGGWLLRLFPKRSVTDRDLARAMVGLGLESDKPSMVLSNRMIGEIRLHKT